MMKNDSTFFAPKTRHIIGLTIMSLCMQESSYMTSDIFSNHMRDVLVPETAELRNDGKGILLLLDNYGAHLDPRMLETAA